MASCSLIFKLNLVFQSFCMLARTRTQWFVKTKPKKAWNTVYLSIFTNFCVVSYSGADFMPVHSNHFLIFEKLYDAKVLLTGHAVAQNFVFVVFQPKTTKNNSHNFLIRQVEETIVMKILQQFRTIVNYIAYMSDCMIEICNTHAITFGYETHFFSQFTFKLHSAWNVLDRLLWV